MSENRLPDYLEHIQQAAADARSFVAGMAKADFLADKRTQQAVIMSLIIIGEAATKVMDRYATFTRAHAEVPWRSMRNMRNRMAHGYFDINLDVVWECGVGDGTGMAPGAAEVPARRAHGCPQNKRERRRLEVAGASLILLGNFAGASARDQRALFSVFRGGPPIITHDRHHRIP